jgi:putative transposase
MQFIPGEIYHVYNQGNNRERIFFEKKNYYFFMEKMKRYLLQHSDLLAWCLMPNHFHWLLKVHNDYNPNDSKIKNSTAPDILPLNRNISILLSSYTKAMNNLYGRSGKLIRSRTKAIKLNKKNNVDDNYPLICFNYIHQNPLKAGLTDRMEDWIYSSFRDYAGIRSESFCNKELTAKLLDLPQDNEEFINQSYRLIPDILVDKVIG